PATQHPFPNDFVNPNRFNAQALALMKFVPVSSDPCGKLTFGIPTTGDEDQVIGRIDWTRSQKQTIFGRYFLANFNDPAIFDGKDILTSIKAGQLSRDQSLTLGDNYTLKANMINSLHFTATRLAIDRGSAPNLINPNTLGVNVPAPVPNALVISVTGYFNVASGTATPGHFNNNAFQIADDVDWMHGAHQVSFGGDWIHYQLNELSNMQTNGQFAFSGQATGDGLLDLLLGLPRTFGQGNPEEENWRQNYTGLYVNDSFKARSNLTLNAGLRWEPYFPAADKFNRGGHFDPAAFAAGVTSKVFTNAPPGLFFCGDPQTPCTYTNRHLADFSPRVGLAWDPLGKGKQTIRAGYGLFYDSPEIFYFDRFADNAPFGSSISLSSPAGGFTNPYQGQTVPPFPLPFPKSSAGAFFPKNGVYVNLPLNLHPTYVQQWNLSVEQQIGPNWLLSATYLGNKTTHLWIGYEANPAVFIPGNCGANPCSTTSNTNARRVLARLNPTTGASFASISQTNDGANASYNGLLLSANHRFSQHFSVIGNYTYSHCISDGDFAGELANSRLIQDPNNLAGERGNCGFDRRHIFNASVVATGPRFEQRILQGVFGNWQVSTIITHYTGTWYSVLSGNDNSLSGIGKDRPNIIGNPNLANPTVQQWFNTKAFVANPTGAFGNAGRDILEGPGFFTLNAALVRSFTIREGQMLQVRWEAFNAFNHPNFNLPETNLTSKNFGQITTTGDPRVMQLALKYVF
ncbi:MAG TPA: carboxypeptidase regulatory-like domain-containing protein, partial [Blastocatellia bacterium]|nr:carboxypeptidase regulatory-like domain-containing protein [Blastocatellia bacterium]